jgi:hypothetical protein
MGDWTADEEGHPLLDVQRLTTTYRCLVALRGEASKPHPKVTLLIQNTYYQRFCIHTSNATRTLFGLLEGTLVVGEPLC